VVQLKEIFDERDFMYLVMEIMTGGEVPIFPNSKLFSCLTELLKKSNILRKKLQILSDQ
jgi:serine/threonine protein kinase